MLEHVNLEEILFLDIETVPQHPDFYHLDEDLQKLWEDKSRFNREKNELSLEELKLLI